MIQRIEIFGDSLLKGVLCGEDGRYRLRAGRDLACLSALGPAVVNHARMGSTVTQGLQAIEKHADALDGHTLVLMDFGGNDSDYDWSRMTEDPAGDYAPHTSPADFAALYRAAVERVKAAGAKVCLCSLPPIDSGKYFRRVTSLGNPEVIAQWLGDPAMLYRWHETYSAAVEKVARETGSALADLRGAFLTRHDFSRLIGDDGLHPTEAGYALLDGVLTGAVRAILEG